MRALLFRLAVGVAVVSCVPSRPAGRVARLQPYLRELIASRAEEFDSAGRFRGVSPHTAVADSLFERLLLDQSAAGDSAIAFLLFLYTGEHSGEALVCETAARGTRMLPVIASYERAMPATGLEPLPQSITGSGTLAPDAVKMIRAHTRCAFDETSQAKSSPHSAA